MKTAIISVLLIVVLFPLSGQDLSDNSFSYGSNTHDGSFTDVDWKEPVTGSKKWNLGLRVLQQFNMPVFHSIIALNVKRGRSNVYLGPHYTHISERNITAEDDITFSQNTYGLNFGYRYDMGKAESTFNLFVQLDFSVYGAEDNFYLGYNSQVQSEEKFVIENCLSIGFRFQMIPGLDLFTGYGIGSTAGAFFMIEEALPHIFLGVQYELN